MCARIEGGAWRKGCGLGDANSGFLFINLLLWFDEWCSSTGRSDLRLWAD